MDNGKDKDNVIKLEDKKKKGINQTLDVKNVTIGSKSSTKGRNKP